MPTTSTQAASDNIPTPRSNGVDNETQPPQTYPRTYRLEDFSQSAINRGQQEINRLITVADEKIVAALRLASTALENADSNRRVNLQALNNAIEEASVATNAIASIFPPGCGGGGGSPSPEPNPQPSPEPTPE